MTAILSWFIEDKNSNLYIMTVGDTKITGNNGETTYTSEAAKIMELQIKCKDLGTPQQIVYYTTSIGFAYSGSSLVALNVYCFLQTLFSNLGGRKEDFNLPDFNSLVNRAKEIVQLYSESIMSECQVILSGFCPLKKIPFIGTIYPELDSAGKISYIYKLVSHSKDELTIVHIGDKKVEILEEINEKTKLTKKKSLSYWRAPGIVLEEIIRKKMFSSIGGNLQIMTIHSNSISSYANVVRLNSHNKNSTLKFRNVDMLKFGYNIGDCIIAINGIMLDTEGFFSK